MTASVLKQDPNTKRFKQMLIYFDYVSAPQEPPLILPVMPKRCVQNEYTVGAYAGLEFRLPEYVTLFQTACIQRQKKTVHPISAFRASHDVLGKFISHLMEDNNLLEFRPPVHFHVQHTSPDEQLWLGDFFLRKFSQKIGTGAANSLAWKGLTRCQKNT